MSAIILQFVGNESIGSELIEWFDHGKFSHVDSVLPDGTLLGARSDNVFDVPTGVQIRPASYIAKDRVLRVALETTQPTVDAYYDFVREQIGKPYDKTAIVGFIAGRNWMEEDSWFCSELCAYALVKSGYLHPLSAPANKIAPDSLLLVCSAFTQVVVPV